MTLRVGQKVVCVDDEIRFVDKHPYRRLLPLPIKKGEVYTISGMALSPLGHVGVYLAEVRSNYPPFENGMERTFISDRFRPIVERKTEVSFTTGADPSTDQFDNRRKVRKKVTI